MFDALYLLEWSPNGVGWMPTQHYLNMRDAERALKRQQNRAAKHGNVPRLRIVKYTRFEVMLDTGDSSRKVRP